MVIVVGISSMQALLFMKKKPDAGREAKRLFMLGHGGLEK